MFAEQGEGFTTTELADAAGVAEGTIFRYFPDKLTLLGACKREVLGVDELLPRLQEAAKLEGLRPRLLAGAGALREHLARAARVFGSMPGRPGGPPPEVADELLDAVSALFAGHAKELRFPIRRAAATLAGLLFSDALFSRMANLEPASTESLVDLFLRGAERR